MVDAVSRLGKLRELEVIVLSSISEADVDKRAPLIGQYRAILAEIADLGGDAVDEGERNGLIDFQSALAERKPGSSSSRRSAH